MAKEIENGNGNIELRETLPNCFVVFVLEESKLNFSSQGKISYLIPC